MKALITGITGMIGSHFADRLQNDNWSVFGVARNSASSRLTDANEPNIDRVDITDRDSLKTVFNKIKPDLVVHMAAQAFNGYSWSCEELTQNTNIVGTRNVLKCCKEHAPDAQVLLACSSAEYGNVIPGECPLKEERLLRPVSPYGVAKLATEAMGYQYFSNYGMKIYLPRLFIHVGTGHPPATAIQNFARQLALISKGKTENKIYVGRLDTARDFIDVRDGVNAMLLQLDKGNPGEPYNICTGNAYTLSDVLQMLIRISGVEVEIVESDFLLRPSDEPLLLGDNTRICNLGWKQNYTITQTLEEVYKDWMNRV
jgi:GDP-4-dehydro-6-deoxy-D-mannose reductase